MILIMAYNFALHISLASIAIDLVLAVASVMTGTSSSNMAFAVDCALDVLSSAILVWRFYGENSRCYDGAQRNHHFDLSANHSKAGQRKELIACIGLGVMFIASGVIVIAKSAYDLLMAADDEFDLAPDMNGLPGIIHVTAVAFVICGLLALGKYVLYRYMDSNSMYLESINSWISSVFALVIVITTVIIQYDNGLWILDPIISIVFSVFMIVYGAFNIGRSWRKLRDHMCCDVEKQKVHYVVIP